MQKLNGTRNNKIRLRPSKSGQSIRHFAADSGIPIIRGVKQRSDGSWGMD